MSATIYFAGGEDVDITNSGNANGFGVDTTAGNRRTSWSRCALIVGSSLLNFTTVLPGNYLLTPAFTANSDMWIHFQHTVNAASYPTTNNARAVGIADPSGVWRLLVSGTGTNGQWKFSTRDGAGTVVDLVTGPSGMLTNAVAQVDIHIVYGVSGSMNLYLNGSATATITYSGDITTNSATQMAQVFFAHGGTVATGQQTFWSEMIVSNSDTRTMGLFTLTPAAAGNTQAWTPSTVANINETTINDATTITDNNAGDISEWTCPTTLPTGQWNVEAIVQSARLDIGFTGPQHFEFVTRTGGVDYSSVDFAGASSFANYHYTWAANPAGSAWLTSDIGAGFNLGIKATT